MSDAKEAIQNDWEQTKDDLPGLKGQDLDQNVGDTVKQATGKEDPDTGLQNRDTQYQRDQQESTL